jgi:heme-degrading monooxygenase HmoA
MTVKIIIKREVAEGKEKKLLPLLRRLRAFAMSQSGYISGETLRNMDHPQDFVVISTWKSADDWKAWQANPDRNEIEKEIYDLIGKETTYGIYYHGYLS